ncbi:MAG: alpha-hydroxy-acid oxidizing protein [Proteobacteria bacterium]|nr:alpha-hydroxy-acid oxidizing protein [Pseudomonadota bacterium]MCH8998524.1 alpha-hydroxy-acid oxidizing protein [Pseudomonadota bacterium]
MDDLRAAAARRLPFPIFDFLDGAAEDERTLKRNRTGFDRYLLTPRILQDVSEIDLATTVLGNRIALPVIVAPTGMPALFHHSGEDSLAPAAARHGTIFTTSTMASRSIEQVAALGAGPKWFQIYVWKERAVLQDFIDRCKNAAYDALCLTVDVPVLGNRERDVRNRLTFPPRPTPAGLVDFLRKPHWLWNFRAKGPVLPANLAGRVEGANIGNLARYAEEQMDRSVTWDTAAWIRERWDGKFLIKGVLRPEDAERAVDAGFDGIIVSNHGGRQLDQVPAPIEVLAEIVAAVDGRAEVILDGGLRRGTDVLKALALGAKACMTGRPFLYGLAAGGGAGVDKAFDIFAAEIRRDMTLAGCPTIDDIGPDLVRPAG